MDGFLDGTIEPHLFEEKKRSLLFERKGLEDQLLALTTHHQSLPQRLSEFFELTQTLPVSYETAIPEEKRDILETLTSNLWVSGKNIAITLRSPFQEVAQRELSLLGEQYRGRVRTAMARLLDRLVAFFGAGGELPAFGPLSPVKRQAN
jgi:hypothetical protein